MRKSWEIGRRACLRGGGAMMGLPVLEAMLPGMKRARAAGASTPKRLVWFVFTGGIPDTQYNSTGTGTNGAGVGGRNGSFWPKTTGPGYETTEILKPLETLGVKQDVAVIRNLTNATGEHGGDGGHGDASNALLTCIAPKRTSTNDGIESAGISVDQFAANELKKANPALAALPSLYLSNPMKSYAMAEQMCWTGPTSRLYAIDQPSAAFREVFGDNTVDAKTLHRRLAFKTSVLHHVKEDADQLKAKLGAADRDTLDRYLTGVRDLEARITASGSTSQCSTPGVPPLDSVPKSDPSIDPNDYETTYRAFNIDMPTHFQQMSDVITHAFQCDRTRVVVVHMFTHYLRFNWLGAPYSDMAEWHGYVEHGDQDGNPDSARKLAVETYVKGCASEVEQFAYLVKKLKSTPDVDGTSLLDNSALVCTSELSYGSGHNMRHLPVIVAGGAGGLVRPGSGRYIIAPGEPLIANLYVTMLNAAGIDVPSFGDSTGAFSLT